MRGPSRAPEGALVVAEPKTDYESLGGYEGISPLVRLFLERTFSDMMIGFHFRDADIDQVHRHETEFACRFLGGPETYSGRDLEVAHRPHPITGGQFLRRLVILRGVLEENDVPAAIIDRWMDHSERLRHRITRDSGSECSHEE